MSEKTRNYLGIAGVVALLSFAIAVLSMSGSYSDSIEPTFSRSFSVSGEGKVVAIPDVAQFTFGVVTEGGKDIAKIQSENTKISNRAIGVAKSFGVESEDIKTQSYNVSPKYKYFRCIYGDDCPSPEIVGYTVSQTILVKVRDFDKVGDILSGVVSSGANSVSSLSFSVDDPTALEGEARAKAIDEARDKAKAVAKAGGFRLGALLSISEGYSQPVYRALSLESAVGGDAGASSPIIEPGSQEVRVSVTLRYEIR